MANRLTAAHWGSYTIAGRPDDPELQNDPNDPAPSRIGRGWLSAARDSRLRIRNPSIRKGWLDGDKGAARNDDSFVEVSWEKASDLAAEELARVIRAHGNGAIFAGSYGWASAGRFHHAQSQLRRFLNLIGGYTAARDTYSHAAAEVLLPHIVGMTNSEYQERMTSWPLIAEHCSLLVAFGGISGRTAQIASGGTSAHEVEHWLKRAAENGTAIVNISPQRGDMSAVPSAEWLAIRPGTDTALMLALAFELLTNGWHDAAFLDRYTSGWPQFEAYLTGTSDNQPKSPNWASPICDVPADAIRSLAARMARERVMITATWGLQRSDHGEQPLWAGLTLAAMLGQIGKPGTGFGFGYGSTTPVGRPKRFIRWPSVPQGRNTVADFIPVARIADMLLSPGEPYTYDGEARRYPDIRLVYWAGGNPFHHHQDLNRLSDAWTRPETVIVNDHSWTATARRADIVLPSTTPLERDDIMINRRDPALIYMSRAMAPLGGARDDHAIFGALAERMGVADAFHKNRSVDEWLHWLWAGCQGVAQVEGFALPEFERFREMGRVDIPDQDEVRIQMGDFVADPQTNRLRTESGKITIFNERIAAMALADCPGHPTWIAPTEWLGAAQPDQLHLISPQPDTRLHGQLDNGAVSQASKISGREPCLLHPDTAARHGLGEGDVLRIFNERGACLAGVRLSESIRPDCIALATGAWYDPQIVDGAALEVHGNPNVLTIDKGASGLSQGNISHTALVRIEKWQGPLPPLRVSGPPAIVPAES